MQVANVRFERDTQLVGLSSSELQAAHYSTLSTLMYGDLKLLRNTRTARQRTRSILIGTAEVMTWALGQTLRGVNFALFRRAAAPDPSATAGS